MGQRKERKPNPTKVPATYLTPEVHKKWKDWLERKGIVQQHFMSKLITFLMEIDKSTRAVIYDEVNEEDRTILAKSLLERIVSGQLKIGPCSDSLELLTKDAVSRAADEATEIIKTKGTRRKNKKKPDK